MREAYETYLRDKHAAADLITAMSCNETRGMLRELYKQAPHAVSKVMAIRHPYTMDQADETEHGVQELLPLI